MFYYKVESSHWPAEFEFKSKIQLNEGQCFKITRHDGFRAYPTRFKVKSVSDIPNYSGTIIEILEVNKDVETF